MEDLSSFPSTASTSQEDNESSSGSTSSGKLKVTLLSSEWRSTKGGVSTINRELAIQLAKHPSVEVSVYLPQCSEEDKQDAASYNVFLIRAEAMPGFDNPVDWLSFLPEGHPVDCVIGYGAVLGRQVLLIKRYHKCKWIQIVHTAPEDLGMYRSNAILRAEKLHQDEVKLCEKADQVVAVGPKLADVFRRHLRSCRKDQDVLNLTPGIFSEFADVTQAIEERKTFSVLMFGPDDNGDFKLNGYDIAARAIADLKDESQPYKLLFVGAPRGEGEKVKDLLLQEGIDRRQLIMRCFCESREQLARLFCEADLAIMPSRTEGFGLAILEALSAGLPVLVSGKSGLGEALKDVLYGLHCVVESDDPKVWAKAIKDVRQKDREMRLEEIKSVRKSYALKYSWEKECDNLVGRMLNITVGGFQANVSEPCKTGEAEKPWLAKQVTASQANSNPNAFVFPRRDSDAILSVKKKIKNKKGFPTEEQCLFFQKKKNKDDRTVSDYNIRNKSSVTLSLHVAAEKMDRLEVIILREGRRLINLVVRPIDSILDLKEKVKVRTGVPRHKQILNFADRELENTRTISDYSIRNKSVIDLVVKIKVYVVTLLTQGTMTLELRSKDTVESVKDKVHAKTKISPYRQILQFNGEHLDDVHSLNYYNVENKSVLLLYLAVEIFVKMSTGIDVRFKFIKSNTIKNVKERIQLSENIPCNMQRLFFLGRRLEDKYTLSYYSIENGSILDCDVLLISVDVKMPNEDDYISVNVCLEDKVRNVIDKIQARVAIPTDHRCLMYNGIKLVHCRTLRDYQIRNGSILDLVKSGVGNVDLRIDEAQRPREASSNHPSTQEVFNRIADKCFEKVDPSNPEELNGFVKYLREVREVLVLDVKTGSLIFTLECGSLKILDDLWEEYNKGHLNEVAQLYLVTNDILKEFGLSSFKLVSNIKEEDYRTCRQRLTIEVTAKQTLDRLREAFFRWIPIRRHTKKMLEHLVSDLLGELVTGTGTIVGGVMGVGAVLAAPLTFGASLVAAAAMAGIGALIGTEVDRRFRLPSLQMAIDIDRRHCRELQRQLISLNRTFTSTTSADALIRKVSHFADASVLPRDITQLVKSSLDRHRSTAPIVEEIRGILNNLKCPDETEIQRLV